MGPVMPASGAASDVPVAAEPDDHVAARHGPRLCVLVVEDNDDVRDLVVRALRSEGFDVRHAPDAATARDHMARRLPDAAVVDIGLPDASGLELLRELTAHGGPPVILLTGRGDEMDRVLGLELGAEDYVVKPFYPRELAARVRRVVSRRPTRRPLRLAFGDLVVDLDSREVTLRREVVALTGRELDLLAHLVSAPRRVFSRDELLRDIWHSSTEWQSPRTVTEHVRRLRGKIEDDPRRPRRIVTVANVGYRFDP